MEEWKCALDVCASVCVYTRIENLSKCSAKIDLLAYEPHSFYIMLI